MKPDGKEYEKEVIVPQIWEAIPDENGEVKHYLVSKPISEYIRKLEANQKPKEEIKNPFKNISVF